MTGFVGNLTAQQQFALQQLKEKIAKIADTNAESNIQLTKMASKILTDDAMYLRFLRARKFDVDKAFEMVVEALRFRIQFQKVGVEVVCPEMCMNELKTGKSFFLNYDKEDRPIVYVRARLHDPSTSDALENQRFTVLMCEYGRRLLRSGETVTVVFDMTKATIKNVDFKSLQFMVNTLQNFYPESLGKILVYNAPWFVNGVWKMVRPWLDPITAAKVNFIKPEEILRHIDEEQTPTEYGGKAQFTYDHVTIHQHISRVLSSPDLTTLTSTTTSALSSSTSSIPTPIAAPDPTPLPTPLPTPEQAS